MTRKKYIMVRTMPDGSKIRQEVDPDDPVLQKVKITKRTVRKTVSAVTLDSQRSNPRPAVSSTTPRRTSLPESGADSSRKVFFES